MSATEPSIRPQRLRRSGGTQQACRAEVDPKNGICRGGRGPNYFFHRRRESRSRGISTHAERRKATSSVPATTTTWSGAAVFEPSPNRTQKVAGSSPASSIAKRLHAGAFRLTTGREAAMLGRLVNRKSTPARDGVGEERQMPATSRPRRTRVERGIYRQPNGKYAVCARHAGQLRFRTVGYDLTEARRRRAELAAELAAGKVPASPRLRFDTVAGWWRGRFEAKVAAGVRSRPTSTSSSRTCCRRSPRDGSPHSTSMTSPPCWKHCRRRAVR